MSSRPTPTTPRLSPQSRLVLAGAVMVGLLAVVALASRGSRPFSGDAAAAREPSTTLWDYALTVWLVYMGVIAVITVYGLVARKYDPAAKPARRGGAGLLLVNVALVLGAVLLALRLFDPSDRPAGDGAVGPRTGTLSAPTTTRPVGDAYDPTFRWEAVAVLAAAVALAAAAYALHRRTSRPGPGAEALAADVAALIDDALDDLRAEPDPRRAVIAAYARMERALAAHGIPRGRSEAPLEYLDRASSALHDRHPPARRLLFELTHLFERAKFSHREVDAEMKEDAIATLESLRDELWPAAA